MKHFLKYGIDKGYTKIGSFAAFMRANLRTTFTYPKTIWYSLRYNAGEKFLLNEYSLYPFNYDLTSEISKDKEPVRLSTNLLTNITEIQALDYRVMPTLEKSNTALVKAFEENLKELYKGFQYNRDNKEYDCPVAVPARVLYGMVNLDHVAYRKGSRADSYYDLETMRFILRCFFRKIEYADTESVTQVMFAMAKLELFAEEFWNELIAVLSTKSFEPEFTKVTPYIPHLFRFKELKDQQNDATYSVIFNETGVNLFVKGYKPVVEAYHAISKASNNNDKINAKEILADLEARFPIVKTHSLSI
jgi:hypothetical protein